MVLIAAGAGMVVTGRTYGQEKKVKDQGEYDLFTAYTKETDPAKKLQCLNEWVEKYPNTDYREEQVRFYNELNQPAKVLELGSRLLAQDPKNFAALGLITVNVCNLPHATAEQLATGQKSAQTLLDHLDSIKPANVTDDAWRQARPGVVNLAKGTLMWITMKPGADAVQRKDYVAAEQTFLKALQQYPDSGDVAYQLGSALISQRNPDKFPQGIYEIARAVALDPAKGGLSEATRKQVDAYLNKIYTQYHGADDAGLTELKALVLASPQPPASFKLKTSAEIAAEKEQAFREKNPQLALWMGIKKELTDTAGDVYFESSLKSADIPQLKGTLVDAKPSCRSRELTLALSDATHAEVTLKLDVALTGKPKTGSEFQFKGVPSTFTKDPFMLTMDVERGNLQGIETEACAPTPMHTRAGAHKGPKSN